MSGLKTLDRLQHWYASNCNDDWEESHGLKIENIGNPGWKLTVDLDGTYLQNIDFQRSSSERHERHDWCVCDREGSKFTGYCGPGNLDELLITFLEWSELHAP